MEFLHVIGLCPDNFSHPNILMFIGSIFTSWFGVKYLFYRNKQKVDSNKVISDSKAGLH